MEKLNTTLADFITRIEKQPVLLKRFEQLCDYLSEAAPKNQTVDGACYTK